MVEYVRVLTSLVVIVRVLTVNWCWSECGQYISVVKSVDSTIVFVLVLKVH